LNSHIITICNEDKEKGFKVGILHLYAFIHKKLDHLGELLKSTSKHFENLKQHRTKCSSIIKNVISHNFLEDLIDDAKDVPFSLIMMNRRIFRLLDTCVSALNIIVTRKAKLLLIFLVLLKLRTAVLMEFHRSCWLF
jgi:hypothetical protein